MKTHPAHPYIEYYTDENGKRFSPDCELCTQIGIATSETDGDIRPIAELTPHYRQGVVVFSRRKVPAAQRLRPTP